MAEVKKKKSYYKKKRGPHKKPGRKPKRRGVICEDPDTGDLIRVLCNHKKIKKNNEEKKPFAEWDKHDKIVDNLSEGRRTLAEEILDSYGIDYPRRKSALMDKFDSIK